jgi:hypothetical protein
VLKPDHEAKPHEVEIAHPRARDRQRRECLKNDGEAAASRLVTPEEDPSGDSD